MKVLNLKCRAGHHAFEGWFSSEADFVHQHAQGLLTCPLCGDAEVSRMPSAPRLHLGKSSEPRPPPERDASQLVGQGADDASTLADPRLPHRTNASTATGDFWRAARTAVARAEDVGSRFAEEARRIHHGEAAERGIRGLASSDEVRSLMEDGIPVMPVPDFLKEPLQ